MELVAATTGGAWTDHPLCTPPVLAHVARTVNDHTSSQARPQLAPLIPYLVSDPGQLDDVQADLATSRAILAAARTNLPADITSALTDRLHRAAADAQLPRRILATRRRHQFLSITDLALRAIHDNAAAADRDHTLRTVLVDAINAQRTVEGLAPIGPPSPTTVTPPCSITVFARLVVMSREVVPVGIGEPV